VFAGLLLAYVDFSMGQVKDPARFTWGSVCYRTVRRASLLFSSG
jgi:hypothetical protein